MTCAALLGVGCGSSAKRPAAGGAGQATTTSSTKTGPSSSRLTIVGTPKFASPSRSAPVLSGVVPIAYRLFAIDPDVVRVKAGSTIVWTNHDQVPENVRSVGGPQLIASQNFGEGATFKVKLTKPGLIHYESTLHAATINGTIEVLR
jgi:plastocyanin